MFQLNEMVFSLYPEFLVLAALIISIFLCTTRYKEHIWAVAVLFLTVAVVYLIQNQFFHERSIQVLGGAYILDSLSVLFRLLTLFISILIILGSVKYIEGFVHKGEFIVLMLTAILGAMFLVSANDLITLFVALETLGLSSIMLAGYSKYDSRSNEAGLKYLLNSAAATAIFLFGLSILYGITGSTQFYEIKYILNELTSSGDINNSIILITVVLIIGGLGFKLASAPFHMWSPDVYEGSPTPVTAFLSVVSKASALAITIRLLNGLFDFAINIWQPVIIFLAVLSMLVGNLVALGEVRNKSSIKRLMAYSSIAQIGYILIGVVLSTPETISACIFYMVIYSIMNIGAFLCIIAFGNEANSDAISDYNGLVKKKPLLVLAFSICLFNLGGLPVPPAGFIAKFILLKASFEAGSLGIILGTVALITTIISIYYYTYIAKIMIVDEPSHAVQKIYENKSALGRSSILNTAIAVSLIGVFLMVIFSHPILNHTYKTAKSVNKEILTAYK